MWREIEHRTPRQAPRTPHPISHFMNPEPRTQNESSAPPPLTIYRPNMRHELGWFETWTTMILNVWGARELIWQLFKRDFFAAYKKSFIGVTWILIAPVAGIVSWIFLQKAGLLQPGEMDVPYPVYVLVGTSMFGFFTGVFYAASGTLDAGKSLIMQVHYPHEAMFFKQMAQHLANFVITLALNIIVLCVFRVTPSWAILLFPLVALPLLLLGAAAGLMLSMINVVAVDVTRIVTMGIGFLMYLTPVIYSDKGLHPVVEKIVKWNPLTYLVCSCRDIIIYGRLYHAAGYFVTATIALFAFMIAWRLFYVSEQQLVERMI